jgi:parvulin-like peptidyl-prolyl isomerase
MKKMMMAVSLLALCAAGALAAQKDIAVVNGQKITGDELTKKLWWQYGAQGLSELIDEKLILEEAARLGLTADQKEVETRFSNLSANYTDKAQFEKNLKSVGWSADELRDLLRRQVLVRAVVVKDKQIAVTDEEAKAFFDKNKERLGAPESVKVSQIFVNTKAEADDAYLALSAGADFAKLSALKSTDANLKKNSGAIGYISKGMLVPDIEKEIFALKAGQYTKVLQTGNGYSIFRADDLKPGQEASFDKIKDDLKTALLNQAITQKLPELASELRQKAKIEVIK